MEWYWCKGDWNCWATWFWSAGAAAWAQVFTTLMAMYITYLIANRAHLRDRAVQKRNEKSDQKKRQDEVSQNLIRLMAIMASASSFSLKVADSLNKNEGEARNYSMAGLPALKRHLETVDGLEKFNWPNANVMALCIGLSQKIEIEIYTFEMLIAGKVAADIHEGLAVLGQDLIIDFSKLQNYSERFKISPDAPWEVADT